MERLGFRLGCGEAGIFRIPLLAEFMSGPKGGACFDGLVAGVDDEIDVGIAQFTADKSKLILRGTRCANELEVGRSGAPKRCGKLLLTGNECGPGGIEKLLAQSRNLRERFALGIKGRSRSEEHTSELQSLRHLVCRLL